MKTKVLFIAGWGRSGSTILSNTLNQLPGYLNVGELNYAWEKLFLEGHTCGYGETVDDCPLWAPIFTRLYGGVEQVPVRDLIAARSMLPSNLDILLGRPASHAEDLRLYADTVGSVYVTAAEVAGCNVIVETSKTPTHLNLLLHASNLDVRVLHLVRDPRATANSWMRKKKRVDFETGAEVFMQTLHPLQNSRRFIACNLTLEHLLQRSDVRATRVRYEDFCQAPASVLEDVIHALRLPFPRQPFTGEREIQLGINHTIWGNPGRTSLGTTIIREDDGWLESLSTSHSALVTAFTLPFLLRYGYDIVPRPSRRYSQLVG